MNDNKKKKSQQPHHWLVILPSVLCAHPDVEVSVLVTGADAESVVSPRRDAGGLNLEDVGGNGPLRGYAHVAMDDGERQISTGRLVHGAHAAAGHTAEKSSQNHSPFIHRVRVYRNMFW